MGINETRPRDPRKSPLPSPDPGSLSNRPRPRATAVAWGICAAILSIAVLYSSCGNSNSSSSNKTVPANTVPLSVDPGPTGSCTNCLYTTVTVCAPGTATCQSIDHVLVDTGSFGLRLLASGGAGGELTLGLSQQTNGSGSPIAECVQFASSFTWGPVAAADIEIAGEKASSVPIQVIGDANYPDSTAPTIMSCTNGGTIPTGDVLSCPPAAVSCAGLGANGILGVGVFTDDCGPACASASTNPGVYFACPTPSTCAATTQAEANQVQNPVWMFPADNNGLSISLPNIPPTGIGAAMETGTLTFGIGTQSDNSLGNSLTVYTTDGSGNFTTQYKGVNYGSNGVTNSSSFLDTGSGAIFFLDWATTGIPECADAKGFYCPGSPTVVSPTPTNIGMNGNSGPAPITVSNFDALLCNSCTNVAFSDLAGTSSLTFDFGLNFFYGKTVFVGIDGQATPAGAGPYWAY